MQLANPIKEFQVFRHLAHTFKKSAIHRHFYCIIARTFRQIFKKYLQFSLLICPVPVDNVQNALYLLRSIIPSAISRKTGAAQSLP